MKNENITLALQYMLSQPPSSTGKRLLSERILADQMSLRHSQLRRSLDELVNRRFLVRRHGSGTFVRKVFPPEALSPEARDLVSHIQVKHLFSEDHATDLPRLTPDPEDQTLQVALWSDLFSTPVQREIVVGIRERIEEAGHHLAEIPVVDRASGQALSAHKLRESSDQVDYDGHIVVSARAQQVRQALGDSYVPTVFLWPSNSPRQFDPLIEVDICHSIQRSVDEFSRVGYRRIAMVLLDESGHESLLERDAYEQAMRWHGHRYRLILQANREDDQIADAVSEAFEKGDAPEALYVSSHHQITSVVRALQRHGRVPGKNIAVITIAHSGHPLPSGYEWSQMVFSPKHVGRITADSVIRVIQTAGEDLCSYAHRCTWKPGTTHLNGGQ